MNETQKQACIDAINVAISSIEKHLKEGGDMHCETDFCGVLTMLDAIGVMLEDYKVSEDKVVPAYNSPQAFEAECTRLKEKFYPAQDSSLRAIANGTETDFCVVERAGN